MRSIKVIISTNSREWVANYPRFGFKGKDGNFFNMRIAADTLDKLLDSIKNRTFFALGLKDNERDLDIRISFKIINPKNKL